MSSPAKATANRFPKITEEGLNDLRQRIGVKITDTLEPWNYEATRDAIRHYAHGIGDDNPLWTDPAYAAKTKFGTLVALPSFLFSTNRIISGYCGGLSGVHAMWAGADWTWHKPVLRNDVITTEAHLKDLVEHQTRFAGRSFQQIYHVDFFNQRGEKVAEADSWVFRTDRDEARERGTKYTEARGRVEPYTEQQLAEFSKVYEAETIRGATPRYWEDVKEGEALPRMMKGPMTSPGSFAMRRAGAVCTSAPTSSPGGCSRSTQASGSGIGSTCLTVRSVFTGTRHSRWKSARPALMTTALSAAPG